ncbi:low-complexity tail membrane protein [Cyanobium sp. Aljojuca 7D2]|uniref:low-complexity tail membrane protein n=1 Tax=Cyanobium sp. Aljojuca 7D2 TaxID=2823698 RepID=UPI0020CF31D4|nr:low-complexity tail membrane protein [Cyanobium sp. Aljojuca 7D2]MCP9891375.1 low-complexity tail membrane protein [Cyanobium sp. Aljojuca 7D2]
MNPRSEPLLWLQLVALGAIPLELLGLLLVLAGADPGPLPGLERLLAWAIGALGPAILLWQRPADVCSLLLTQVPVRARSEAQRGLSALQSPLSTKVALVLAASALLPLFWWIDQHAALAAPLSPLSASPRFVGLLLACPLLALMLWQWQQLSQAIGLLSRSPAALATCVPLTPVQLETERLCLGLPLLLLSPLQITNPTPPQPTPTVAEVTSEPGATEDQSPTATPEPLAGGTVAIEPEQPTEEGESTDLDEEIT